MKLQFSSTQSYQLEAIQAVVDVFSGHHTENNEQNPLNDNPTAKNISNQLLLNHEQIHHNILKKVDFSSLNQVLHPLTFSNEKNETVALEIPNLTIEMETGTGKTYTYLRTIYELNQTYHFKKFVIVVPSVAIREGVLKNLEITHEHFQKLYNRPNIDYNIYDSNNLAILQNFAVANSIQILVINIDSFTKTANIINQTRETGVKPIEYLQSTQPIVIMDEPQNMETNIRKRAIANLNPMCILRYSATHRNLYNLIYQLNPVQAYDLGLVKQIEVEGITEAQNIESAYVCLEGFQAMKNETKAKLRIEVNGTNEVKKKLIKAKIGDDLYQLSQKRQIYQQGFIVKKIDTGEENLTFENGLIIQKGISQGGYSEEMMRFQIERTIATHFEKEKQYQAKGIKVLSLFFIDKVANYKRYLDDGSIQKGKFSLWFEEIFRQYQSMPNYQDLYTFSAEEAQNGYFSKDKKGRAKDTNGATNADNETYNLIMRDKERLLNPKVPLRFIFSHSALREGWDNPNVFQICTLNESQSNLKKRQEIGRGLRLPVNAKGQRIFDKNINILTVIANETYSDFSNQLQKEVKNETGVTLGNRIQNARKKHQINLNKPLSAENYPEFFQLLNIILPKLTYQIDYGSQELIGKTVDIFKKMPAVTTSLLKATKGRFDYEKEASEMAIINEVSGQAIQKIQIPNVYEYIQKEIAITKSSIFEILKKSGRVEELKINPTAFLNQFIHCARKVVNGLITENINYRPTGKQHDFQPFFKKKNLSYTENRLYKVQHIDKTLTDYVLVENAMERDFAKRCDNNEAVIFYCKVPTSFQIPTPFGNYQPSWFVILKNEKKVFKIVYQGESNVLKMACVESYFVALRAEAMELVSSDEIL